MIPGGLIKGLSSQRISANLADQASEVKTCRRYFKMRPCAADANPIAELLALWWMAARPEWV